MTLRDSTRASAKMVARGLRVEIKQGAYADGEAVSQGCIASAYNVSRHVACLALQTLESEGLVSEFPGNRYHVNSSYLSRQLQLVKGKLDLLERFAARSLVILGEDPAFYYRVQRPLARPPVAIPRNGSPRLTLSYSPGRADPLGRAALLGGFVVGWGLRCLAGILMAYGDDHRGCRAALSRRSLNRNRNQQPVGP